MRIGNPTHKLYLERVAMKEEFNTIWEILDELYPYAFAWLCIVLLAGSFFYELAMRAL